MHHALSRQVCHSKFPLLGWKPSSVSLPTFLTVSTVLMFFFIRQNSCGPNHFYSKLTDSPFSDGWCAGQDHSCLLSCARHCSSFSAYCEVCLCPFCQCAGELWKHSTWHPIRQSSAIASKHCWVKRLSTADQPHELFFSGFRKGSSSSASSLTRMAVALSSSQEKKYRREHWERSCGSGWWLAGQWQEPNWCWPTQQQEAKQ